MPGAVEELIGLGSSFDGTRLAPAGTVWHLILGDDFEQASDELLLLFAGAGLRDGATELAHGVHRAFETSVVKEDPFTTGK